MTDGQPILLNGYAAQQCARRIHNDFDTTIPRTDWQPSPTLQMRMDEGRAFEDTALASLLDTWGDRALDLRGPTPRADRIERTVAAMQDRVPIIVGGQLPDDLASGRTGRPDILLGDGSAYWPGDIKNHRTVSVTKTTRTMYSSSDNPLARSEVIGLSRKIAPLLGDFLQLAHYSRMIDAAGFGPSGSERLGFIIGSDDLTDLSPDGFALIWHDLREEVFATYSRSRGQVKRSALDRYDHEFDFRFKVAGVAAQRTGAPSDPAPLVIPIGQEECLTCPWHEACASVIVEHDASWRIKSGRLTIREWLALNTLGITTTVDLAAVDPTDETFLAAYLPEVSDQPKAVDRLRDAITRAEMLVSGEVLRRTTTEPIDIPPADIEIDLDAEWDSNDRVYLWGVRTRQGDDESTAIFTPFADWTADFDEGAELAVARDLLDLLTRGIRDAASQGQSVAIYHYSHVEVSHLRRILGGEALAELQDHFVDLLPIVRSNYFGVAGLSIKEVAPAFGFKWRDADPGGLQSQVWLNEVRTTGDEEMKTRLLQYNEDDVKATAAVRDGLRSG